LPLPQRERPPTPHRWLVRGDQFITMMDATRSPARPPRGKAFNIYFLAGAIATYQEAGGPRDGGSWHSTRTATSCVLPAEPAERQEGCFRVTVDGAKVAWRARRQAAGDPAGRVSEMLLKSMRSRRKPGPFRFDDTVVDQGVHRGLHRRSRLPAQVPPPAEQSGTIPTSVNNVEQDHLAHR